MHTQSDYLVDQLAKILERNQSVVLGVELFGLQKLSGHPLVDPRIGGRSSATEAKTPRYCAPMDAQRLRNNFCRMYVEGYIRRNGRWPRLQFSEEAKRTTLYQLCSIRELKIGVDSYPLDDWDSVTFAKHLDFEYYPNFTDLMDDRSISYYRSEAAATWRREIKPRSHKRLLLEMLSRPDISIRAIIEQVRSGDIPYDWMIVCLYPKEREFKLAARMFSMMVFEMRVFFACTEANLASSVFPNLPQQTMTLTKEEIQDLFHIASSDSRSEDWQKVFLEVDLTRWNLRWHAESVNPIGRTLEDMFGLPGVYTVVHHFFECCLILVRVAECEPEGLTLTSVKEGDLAWTGHKAGFEGIWQKGWTCATYAMIDLAVSPYGHKYYVIGQADNQLVVLTVDCRGQDDRAVQIARIAKEIAESIEDECSKVGQEAKPDECIQSTTVVTYSKNVYIHGAEYMTSIKAFSRIFPHGASDFPSVGNSISSITSACITASESLKHPWKGYFLNLYHILQHLRYITRRKTLDSLRLTPLFFTRLTMHMRYFIVTIPGILGGMDAPCFTDYLYKGGSDPLGKAYSGLYLIGPYSPLIRRYLGKLHTGSMFSPTPNLEDLIIDPFSLPFSRPRTPEQSITTLSRDRIHDLTTNKVIRELTSAQVNTYEEELMTRLIAVSPLNPVLLSDIRSFSILGARDMISRMFTVTRTVQSLIQGNQEISVCGKVLATGANYFTNTILRFRSITETHYYSKRIYDDVQRLRSFWTKGKSRSIVGVSTYQPFDFIHRVSSDLTSDRGFKIWLADRPRNDVYHCQGKYQPYLGQRTREKRSDHGYRIITCSAPERAVKKLCDIATQPGVDSSFITLIEDALATRTGVNIWDILPKVGTSIGGDILHRYGSSLGYRAANTLGALTFSSHCLLGTDNAPPVSGGEVDYPIMIQECKAEMVGMISLYKSLGMPIREITLVTEDLPLDPLPSEIVTSLSGPIAHYPQLRGNTIAWADEVHLRRTHGPEESPFIGLLDLPSGSNLHPRHAVARIIHRATTTQSSALAVADRGHGAIRLSLDLLEIRGIGPNDLCSALSKEAALLAIEVLFARSYDTIRWSPTPFIISVCQGLARSVLIYLKHPMFKDDTFVVKVLGLSPLSYHTGPVLPLVRLANHLATTAHRLFWDPASSIYTRPVVIFDDDIDTASSDEIIRSIKVSFFQALLLGEITEFEGYRAIRKVLSESIIGTIDEDERLSQVYRYCITVYAWCRANNFDVLAERMSCLYEGLLIRRSYQASSEVIRYARVLNSMTKYHADPSTVNLTYPKSSDSEFQWISPMEFIGHPPREGPQMSRVTNLIFHSRRMKGRMYGRDSSAGYSYGPIAGFFKRRIVINIGTGYGSGSAVALLSGASQVFGSDLYEDLDPELLMSGYSDPPAIQYTCLSARFERIPTSSQAPGNILLPSIVPSLSRCPKDGVMYIIDIPLRGLNDIITSVRHLLLVTPLVETLIRWIGERQYTQDLLSELKSLYSECNYYVIFQDDCLEECWFHILTKTPEMKPRLIRSDSRQPSIIYTREFPYEALGGGADYIKSLLHGPYKDLSSASLQACNESWAGIMSSSVGDISHRFTYDQWTDLIHAWITNDILTSTRPSLEVEKILNQDAVEINIGDTIIPVIVTKGFKHTISRLLSRLL